MFNNIRKQGELSKRDLHIHLLSKPHQPRNCPLPAVGISKGKALAALELQHVLANVAISLDTTG